MVRLEFAGEDSVIQRHARDDSDIILLCQRKDLRFHFETQSVVGKLNDLSLTPLQYSHGLFRKENRNAVIADFALLLKKLHGFRPITLENVLHLGIVKLVKVNDILFQTFQAGFAGAHDVFTAPVLGADAISHHISDLRGDINVVPRGTESFSKHLLTAAIAVNVGGIEEVHTEFAGTMDCGNGVTLRNFAPAPFDASGFGRSADGPRAKTDFAYLEAGLAESAVVHSRAPGGARFQSFKVSSFKVSKCFTGFNDVFQCVKAGPENPLILKVRNRRETLKVFKPARNFETLKL